MLCWSSFNIAAKYAIDHGFSSVLITCLRFGTAGVVLLPLLIWRYCEGAALPKLHQALILGMLGGPLLGLFIYGGYHYAPLSHGLLFAPSTVFLIGTAIGVFMLGEKTGPTFLTGAAMVLTGLVILSGLDILSFGLQTLKGDLMFVCAGSLWASFTSLMRYWRIEPINGTAAIGTVAAFYSIPVWLIAGTDNLASLGWQAIAFQAFMQGMVGGVAALAVYVMAIRSLGAARASLLPAMTPGTAMLIAFLLFGQAPTIGQIAGIVLVTLGLIRAIRP